jgi:hypothetical protein
VELIDLVLAGEVGDMAKKRRQVIGGHSLLLVEVGIFIPIGATKVRYGDLGDPLQSASSVILGGAGPSLLLAAVSIVAAAAARRGRWRGSTISPDTALLLLGLGELHGSGSP